MITSFAWSAERKSCVLSIEFHAETIDEAYLLADMLIPKPNSPDTDKPELDDQNCLWVDTGRLAGLPKMPCSSQGVLRKARREKWLIRTRPNCSKWNQIHINNLPLETIQALRGKP